MIANPCAERVAAPLVVSDMDRIKACAVLMLLLGLVSCGQAQAPRKDGPGSTASPTTDMNADGEAAGSRERPSATEVGGADDGRPDLTAPLLTPEAERGAEGARNVLLSFARAIELKDYGQAWAMLGRADKRKWDEVTFAALFARMVRANVAIPVGTMEGAAGSSYYTAPIVITGRDTEGRPIRLEGKAVLRRVNDVEGATPAQLRWHFETLALDRAA